MSTIINGGQWSDRRRFALILCLSLSVLFNLFLVAMIAAWFTARPHLASPPGALSGVPLWRALAEAEAGLKREDVDAFNGALARDLPRITAASQPLLEARRELAGQISAEHFDRESTRRALMVWRTGWDTFIDGFSDSLVDALAEVSPEGRRELVRAAEQRRARTLGPLN
jgi:hypothetical protein